jgi:hypothetical protein
MSTNVTPAGVAADPENRLHWHSPRRRLAAEEIRDAILFVSDQLSSQQGGSYLPTPNRQYVTSTANVNPAIYDLRCRSVYVPVVRSALYEVFQAFDFADPSVLSGQRESTTVAPQALFMMNSKITAEASRLLAETLLGNTSSDDGGERLAAQLDELYYRAYARRCLPTERARAVEFLTSYAAAVSQRESLAPDLARKRAWQALCRAVIAGNEFIYVD